MRKFGRLPVDSLAEKSRIEKELEDYRSIENHIFSTKNGDLSRKNQIGYRRPTAKLEKTISIAMN